MDLTYPSATFPPPPSLRLTVPDSWQPLPMPDAIVAAADPNSPPEFRVTMLAVVTRVVRSDADLDALAATVHSRTVATFPSATNRGSETTEIAGHPAVVTAWTITVDRPPFELFQAEALLVVPTAHPDARDLIQLTGTCPAALADHYASAFRASMQTLQLSA
jgi:hypothetical protein